MSEEKEGKVTINGRTYPDRYLPGSHWAVDRAWEILNVLEEGAIPDVARWYLAGAIAGVLIAERDKK